MPYTDIEKLKRDFFKWHYENQEAVSADIADWWMDVLLKRDKELLEKIEELPEVMVDVVGIEGSMATGAIKRDKVTDLIKKQNNI